MIQERTSCSSYRPKAGDRKGISPLSLERLLSVQSPGAASPSSAVPHEEQRWCSSQTACPHPAQKGGIGRASHPASPQISSTEVGLCLSLCPHGGKRVSVFLQRAFGKQLLEQAQAQGCVGALSSCSAPPDFPGYPVLGTCTTVETNWNDFLGSLSPIFSILMNKIMQNNLA